MCYLLDYSFTLVPLFSLGCCHPAKSCTLLTTPSRRRVEWLKNCLAAAATPAPPVPKRQTCGLPCRCSFPRHKEWQPSWMLLWTSVEQLPNPEHSWWLRKHSNKNCSNMAGSQIKRGKQSQRDTMHERCWLFLQLSIHPVGVAVLRGGAAHIGTAALPSTIDTPTSAECAVKF